MCEQRLTQLTCSDDDDGSVCVTSARDDVSDAMSLTPELQDNVVDEQTTVGLESHLSPSSEVTCDSDVTITGSVSSAHVAHGTRSSRPRRILDDNFDDVMIAGDNVSNHRQSDSDDDDLHAFL